MSEPKKIEDAIWKVEQEGEMKVPAYIIGTQPVMEKMKKDRTLWQLKNVASLKGIINHASVMPDGHEGYGFPIGGVAAFDANEGIVSPGGVGYDINCIDGKTKVLTPDGCKKMSDFPKEQYSVMTKKGEQLIVANPSFFMSFVPRNKVIELVTESGNRIRATEDHPFLTIDGMVPAGKLSIGSKLIMNEDGFFIDIIDEIKEVVHNDFVYDFTIPKTHNFIANNFVVSNCGVRLLKTNLTPDQVRPKIKEICDKLFVNVPSGVGSESKLRISHEELDEAVKLGIDWAIEKGYGRKEDKPRTEEYGKMEGADPSAVTPTAKKRGKSQFGTLGAGNHFLEIQVVEKIFDPVTAKAFGLEEGKVTVMIHCGSRGYGHQICTDIIPTLLDLAKKQNLWLPDKELVYAPIQSPEGQKYLKGMKCAVNYAFINRHVIMHWTRESFDQVFGPGTSDHMHLLYDVAHNIAKFEKHKVNGKDQELLVHRKGATRAFPAGREELPQEYRSIGQPVLIPGSMGTSSYVLVGQPKGLEISWGSTCHGAGRVMSRGDAIRSFKGDKLKNDLWNEQKIYVRATDPQVIAEEAPGAYKNVDDVVESVEKAGISKIVARLKPIGVVKG